MEDGQKVITIAHPEHSSGELKSRMANRVDPDAMAHYEQSHLFYTVLVCRYERIIY